MAPLHSIVSIESSLLFICIVSLSFNYPISVEKDILVKKSSEPKGHSYTFRDIGRYLL